MRVNVISESSFTVQGHGVHTAFVENVEGLKRHTAWEVIQNSNKPADVVHLHTVGPFSLAKLLFARGAKVVSAHVTPDSFVGSIVGAKYWYPLARAYLRWFYGRADAVVAVSEEVSDQLRSIGVKSAIFVVPNTINTDLFKADAAIRRAARRKIGFEADEFVVLGAGQVQPRKRVDTFAEVASQVPEVKFVWVGGIPFKRLAAASADMARLMSQPPSNVHFTGQMPRDEAVEYFLAADLFFLPSIQETFGIVIVEAAAAGLPVLLRDLSQYKTTFGANYESGDDQSFARIIRKFSKDKQYYREWQSKARVIAAMYGLETGAKRLIDVYEAALAIKNP